MRPPETIPVCIKSIRGQASVGTVVFQVWDKKERTTRAFKVLGISWAMALGAVLIPFLHFILVPLLILAGPIAFFLVAGQEQVILGGTGGCPECKLEFEIVRTAVEWPISDLCNHCQSQLKIERMTGS